MSWEKLTRIKQKVNKEEWIRRLFQFATVKELREVCKDRGFRGYSDKNKSGLINSIISNLKKSELEELLNNLSVTNRNIKYFRELWDLILGKLQVTLYGKEVPDYVIDERSKEIDNLLIDMEGSIPESKKGFIPKEYGLKDVNYRLRLGDKGWTASYHDKETNYEFEIEFTHDRKPLSLNIFFIDDEGKSYWKHLGNYASVKQAVKKIYSELLLPFPEKEKVSTPIKCHDITKWTKDS